MFDHKLNFLEALHGKPALATVSMFSGGFFTGKPQTHDHSSMLGICPNERGSAAAPLKLYFRHTPNGYVLAIKNTGEYYNQFISESWLEILGAVKSTIEDLTVFTLIDHQNKPITLDNLQANHSPISLMTEDKRYVGGIKVKGSPYVYLGNTKERSKITFILSVLERKVPDSES
ncbi:hypothetical protein C1886_14390 [Pseudomonas sp. FW300-N1A1]|nr:hypothetical protein C1886_14390 [Pseudomonas sp. FW300-N1A1]